MQLKRLAPLAILVIGLSACDQDMERMPELGPVTPADPIPASNFVNDVSRDGAAATYVAEELPTGDAEAPLISGSRWYVSGGSLVLNVTVEETATDLYVSTSNADFGYFRVPLDGSAARTDEEVALATAHIEKRAAAGLPLARGASAFVSPRQVTVTLTPSDAARRFDVVVVASDGAVMSASSRHTLERNAVASSSAELQVSLNWIDDVDLDLRLRTPSGDEIYFADKSSADGGELDLDSNPACSLDRINNENITWGTSTPTAGEYAVVLDLWSECSQTGPFPYLITVTVGGESTMYEGTIAPADPDGGRLREIVTFSVAP